MGNRGSRTAKARISPSLAILSKWNKKDVEKMLLRSKNELSDYFALNLVEFEVLMGKDSVGFFAIRDLFENTFVIKGRGIADKFEVLSVSILASSLTSIEKVEFLFDVFNFNDKGYLLASELSLLILSAINGCNRVDHSIKTPSEKFIDILVSHAMTNYATSVDHIRRPELVKFSSDMQDIRYFLDAWSGHAGQVLLSTGEQWRDFAFPATEISVTPSSDWYSLGFPPHFFVRWRRKENIEPITKQRPVFTHSISMMKTQDRRIQYHGHGIVANGIIRRGMLADKWILNAIAIVTAKPNLFIHCFPTTGQENAGRYALRIFESQGWRTIFFDDRIPCTVNGVPLFSHSSDPYESCILLVEKGLAKYFGSYGHLGICGSRSDAPLMGLRLLTGGHILRYFVSNFDWRSVESDCVGANGMAAIDTFFDEGSLVAFGLSEYCLYSITTLSKSPSRRPPHGYFFPMVGKQIIEGYRYLILKDPWGVVFDYITNGYPEDISGHCRTFRIKVEDIPTQFDTIVVSRFPDFGRLEKDGRVKLPPWHSEFLRQPTFGVKKPAVFILRVFDRDYRIDEITKENHFNLAKMLREEEDYQSSLKRKGHDRVIERTKSLKSLKESSRSKVEKAINLSQFSEIDDTVDITFTISSCCDWIYSGAPSANCLCRVALVPSYKTRQRMRLKKNILGAKKDLSKNLLNERMKSAERMASGVPVIGSETSSNSSNFFQKKLGKKKSMAKTLASKEPESDTSFDMKFVSNHPWISQRVQLEPGIYFIFADISFEGISYPDLASKCTDKKFRDEFPWLESLNHEINEINLQVSSGGRFVISNAESSQIPKNNVDLSQLEVEKDGWNFEYENQAESANRGLVNLLVKLNKTAEYVEAVYQSYLQEIVDNPELKEFLSEESNKKTED